MEKIETRTKISNDKGKDQELTKIEKEMFYLRIENENLKTKVEILRDSLKRLRNTMKDIKKIINFD